MHRQSIMELIEVERLARQLRLLNEIQSENLVGSWERLDEEEKLFWSDSMFLLHQLPGTEDSLISTENASSRIHPDDLALFHQSRLDLEQYGYADFRFRLSLPESKIRHIHAKEKKLIENGIVVYRGQWHDEVLEKELQQPALEANDKLSIRLKIFERAEEVGITGSWEINLETFETFYSDNVYRIYGLQPQSIPPHVDTFRKFIHPDDRNVVLRSWEKAYVEMIPLHLEYRIVREDAEVRYISQASHLIKNNKGEQILSGNIRDVTEQKLLELQLREANEILTLHNELFLQSEQISQLGTWQVNLNTRKTVYSSNLYRLYGVKPYSILAGIQNFLQFIHPDDQEFVRDSYAKIFDEHIAPQLEFRIMRSDGKLRTLRQKSRFIKTDREEMVIGIVQDITDQQQKDVLLKEANEKLLIQNEAFRQAEKMAGTGNWVWHLDSNELYFSDNIYNIYGLRPQSVAANFPDFIKFTHPDDRMLIKDLPEKISAERQPMTVDYRIVRPDGDLRYLRAKNQPITNADGQTIIIGVIQDVTAEVQLQQQIAGRMRFAELLSDSIGDRIFITDTTNNIISWNKSCEEFYRQKKENALGKNFFDIVPQLHVPQVIERFKKALSGERVHVPVMPIPQIPGHFQEILSVPLKNETGRVTGVLHVMHDITQQQQLQGELSGRLQFIEKLLEASVDRIIAFDKDFHFQLWNKQCEKHFGLTAQQVIGKNILEVFPNFKSGPLYKHCMRALEGYTTYVPANEAAGPSGYQEYYFVPLKDEGKEVTGILWVVHDLSERFIAEQRLRTSEAHLGSAQQIGVMGNFELDVAAGKLNWSDEVYGIFEYPLCTTVTAQDVDDRIVPEDLEPVKQAMGKMQEGWREPIDTYFRILMPDGRIKHLHSRVQMTFNENGAPVKMLGIVQDITIRKEAEEELRESQHFGREIADSAPDLLYVMDIVKNKVLFINDRVNQLLGHDANYLYQSGDMIKDIVHPEDYERRMQHIAGLASLTDTDIREIDVRMKGADGMWRWFKIRDRLFKRNADGTVWQTIGAAQDITEKKNAEAQILKQQELLQQAEEIAHIGSWEYDTGTKKLLWSDEVFRIYGYAPNAFEPNLEFYLETIHPDDRVLLRKSVEEASAQGTAYSLTCRIFTLDGELRYIHTRGRAMRNEAGNIYRIVGTMQDVTSQKLMESELRKRNQNMRSHYEIDRLTENVKSIGSWQWDVASNKLLWTGKMFELLGLKPYSFIPTVEAFVELVYEDDRHHIQEEIQLMLQMPEGPLPEYEFRAMVNNSLKYFRVSSKKMRDGAIIGTTMEITQDALLRHELSDKVQQLQEMNEELSSFAFIASHDLREPLRKIQIFSDWLVQKETEHLSAEGVDRFNRIQAAVSRMDTLIDDILDYSRIGNGYKKLIKNDLNQVLDVVKSDLQQTIEEKNAVIDAEQLPVVVGNDSQLMQLFKNLISNSLKYQKDGVPPHIRIRYEEVEGRYMENTSAGLSEHYALISFTDNGIGFDPEYSKKIFQMFQRLHGAHEYPGTGMGLAICKKILEYHNGFITASGIPGQGAVFNCYFPLQTNVTANIHEQQEAL